MGLLKVIRVLRSDLNSLVAAPDGTTALHFAIGLGHAALGKEIVESLLLSGADPNIPRYESGERPLHLACASTELLWATS